jgi:hypothetical protein
MRNPSIYHHIIFITPTIPTAARYRINLNMGSERNDFSSTQVYNEETNKDQSQVSNLMPKFPTIANTDRLLVADSLRLFWFTSFRGLP